MIHPSPKCGNLRHGFCRVERSNAREILICEPNYVRSAADDRNFRPGAVFPAFCRHQIDRATTRTGHVNRPPRKILHILAHQVARHAHKRLAPTRDSGHKRASPLQPDGIAVWLFPVVRTCCQVCMTIVLQHSHAESSSRPNGNQLLEQQRFPRVLPPHDGDTAKRVTH